MPVVSVYDKEGEQAGEIELNEELFGAEINEDVLFEVSQALLAAQRRGTANTKTRAEVRGGGRKPWRQKGTGRARHGTIRSPIWTGGGVVFGPKPRSYRQSIPKKKRRAAMRSALSSKVNNGELIVLNEISLSQPKTKEISRILDNLNAKGKVLLVTADQDRNVYLSGRNLERIKTTLAGKLNVLDILDCDQLIMTKDAVSTVEEVFAS